MGIADFYGAQVSATNSKSVALDAPTVGFKASVTAPTLGMKPTFA